MMAILSIGAWAENVCYTLDGTITGGSNGYYTESEITQNNMTWMVTGNTTMSPWRLGGKSFENVDKPVYNTTPMANAISKVSLKVGTADGITVNSLKLIVASDASFTNQLDVVTATFTPSSTIDFVPSNGASWATGAYYKFVFNTTVSVSSNKFVQFIEAKFYTNEELALAAPTFSPAGGTFYAPVNVTITAATDATIYYTTDGNDPTTSSAVYSDPINISQNTTLKAIAVTEEATSAVAEATYTFESITTVDNIAAYVALGNGAYAAIANPVTVYYVNGYNVWVKDNTGYMCIYGRIAGNMNYKNGDIIPGGFGGYLKEYNGGPEMTFNGDQDLFGFQAATEGDAINPEEVTTAGVTADIWGHYVVINSATISDISSKNFNINDAAGTLAGYNTFSGISIPSDGATYNITGIVASHTSNDVTTIQLLPTAFEKVVNIDDLPTVDNIAGLLATDAETDVKFSNPVTAVYHSGNQLYINDASGFMLVYGHLDNTYSNGDQISGIAGNWKLYNGMTEMIPIVSTFTEGTPGTPVQPALITIEEIDQSMIHNYLRIENCTLDSIAGSNGRNYTLTDETGEMIMRLNFSEITIGDDFDYDATYNVEGFLAYYKSSNGETEQLQFYPNLIEKVGGTVVVPGDVNGDGFVTSADVTALYSWLLSNDDSALVNPDQDGDGNITAGDVTAVYNILLGI